MVTSLTMPHTSLQVSSLCFGANVFGWSIHDQSEANALLSDLLQRGVNFFDSADMYVQWLPGNAGGESERMLGTWLKQAGVNRDEVVIATKVGKMTSRPGLHPDNIRAAATESLQRLGVDTIDLYYAHRDDETVPIADVLGAFQELIDEGLVRHIGASNFTGARLRESMEVARQEGLTGYIAVQNEYNLVVRDDYEHNMVPVLNEFDLAGFPYFALASGFLTGKYRKGQATDSVRVERVESSYFTEDNFDTVERLVQVASGLGVQPSTVALAWLRSRPGVTAPIASASKPEQLDALLAELTLSPEDLAFLSGD